MAAIFSSAIAWSTRKVLIPTTFLTQLNDDRKCGIYETQFGQKKKQGIEPVKKMRKILSLFAAMCLEERVYLLSPDEEESRRRVWKPPLQTAPGGVRPQMKGNWLCGAGGLLRVPSPTYTLQMKSIRLLPRTPAFYIPPTHSTHTLQHTTAFAKEPLTTVHSTAV